MKNDKTAALIPALDERAHIADVVTEAALHVDLVCVVDDGSTDDTAEIASRSGASVVQNSRSLGVGGAVRRGFRYLLAMGCDTIVTLDADGSHLPRVIPDLLLHHRGQRSEMTIGSRFGDVNLPLSVPSPKLSANRFAAGVLGTVLRRRFTDVASGMRVFDASLVSLLILTALDDGYGFIYESLCIAVQEGFDVSEVSIPARYDAKRMLATSVVELQALITSARGRCDASAREPFRRLVECVADREYFAVRFESTGQRFVFLPIPYQEAYMIQEQDPYYDIDPRAPLVVFSS